jgi:hypothetical protein
MTAGWRAEMKLQELHESKINESTTFVMFAQYLADLGLPAWQAALIYIAATLGPIGVLLSYVGADSIKDSAKGLYAQWKANKKVTSEDLEILHNQLKEVSAKMKPGEKAWLTQLSKRLDSAESKTQKATIKKEIEDFIASKKISK